MIELDSASTNAHCVLVTGGCGFIGSALAPDLADRFDRVVLLDNMLSQVHPRSSRPVSLDPRAELVVGDVRDAATLDSVIRACRPDVVVHLAAETGTGQSLMESSRHASTNVVGTAQLLDALVRNRALPRRLVLSSSRAVYGEGAWRRTDTGEMFYPGQRAVASLDRGDWDFGGSSPTAMLASCTSPAPVSVYGATKLAQENMVLAWARSLGVEPVVLRLQNVYGPGQSLTNPYTGILSLFCRLARSGQSIPLYEDGLVRRDFVLIDDVVDALVAAITTVAPGQVPLDIGSGEYQTITGAAALITRQFHAPPPHVTGQYRLGDVRHAWADISLAKERLGWRPRHSLESGIRQLSTWVDDCLERMEPASAGLAS